MPILLENLSWMSLNVFLAILGLFFSFFITTKRSLLRIPFFILWFLFVPNTIYLLTDIQYFPEQFFRLDLASQLMLTVQYLCLLSIGLVTYYLGMKPFDKLMMKSKAKSITVLILVLFNYLIAFGVILGKFERIHSWYVFITPQKVISSSLSLLSSWEIIVLTLTFGSIFNAIYFLLRKRFRLR